MIPSSRALPFAVPSLAAWAALLLGGSAIAALPILCAGRIIGTLPTGAELGYALSWLSPSGLGLSWAVMVAAMMLPLSSGPLAHVVKRSLRDRRISAIAQFLLGYLGLWLLSGVLFLGLAILLRIILPSPWALFAGTLVLVLLWQASPTKQVTLNRCHLHPPLTTFRPGALGFGLAHGAWCLASCGPLMLAALLAPTHSTGWMIFVALYIWAERWETPRRPAFELVVPRRVFRMARYQTENVRKSEP